MSTALIAPEYEIFDKRYRWTAAECAALAAEGRLPERYELIDGEIINKMGQNPPHASTLTRLFRILLALFSPDFLRIQAPITLSGTDGVYNEPELDIAVTREAESAYEGRHPGPEDLLLVVEVSDTSLRTDLIVKARLYARAGIAEYWALDLHTRQLHQHCEPSGGEYAVVTVHSETETVTLTARPDARIAVAALLPTATA